MSNNVKNVYDTFFTLFILHYTYIHTYIHTYMHTYILIQTFYKHVCRMNNSVSLHYVQIKNEKGKKRK